MKKCRITVLRRALFEDLRDAYMPADFGLCTAMKEGDVFLTGGLFGNSKPKGFCEYAWQAVQNLACTLAGGGKVFGEEYNIACCNEGIRPVILKLEAVDEPDAAE
ncbi:MAG: TIGR04076 family protein [Clostridiales bacterium]|nr:TIGR04076 family protein [Clostridiales bacterium]